MIIECELDGELSLDCFEPYRNLIRSLLHDNHLKVQFMKKDGTIRQMKCTLIESDIDTQLSTGTRTPNPEVQSVWDVDAGGWRSFRWDSVNNITMDGK